MSAHEAATKARAIIAGSIDEAVAYARTRIDEIDAEVAQIDDAVATAEDNAAVALDTIDRLRAADREVIEAWRQRGEELRAIEDDLARIDRETAAQRDQLARWDDYLASYGDATPLIERVDALEEELAQSSARLDELAQTAADARGLGAMLAPTLYGDEMAAIEVRIAELQSLIPAAREVLDNRVQTIAAVNQSATDIRVYLAEAEQEYAEQAQAWQSLKAEQDAVVDVRNQTADDVSKWEASLAEQRAFIAEMADRRAGLVAERTDLEQVIS